jgi:hypothetical protein
MLTRVLLTTILATAIGSAWADTDTTAQYPNLPPAKNYVRVARSSVSAFAKKWKLSQQQKAAALAFIFHRYPVREFEKMSLDDSISPGRALVKRGLIDPSTRRTAAYRDDLDTCNTVSESMATDIVKDALKTYNRKVLSPDEMTRSLFASTSDKEIEDAIAGIWRETPRDEFLRVSTYKFPIRDDDKVYSYTTSFGAGYVVSRQGAVVHYEMTSVY